MPRKVYTDPEAELYFLPPSQFPGSGGTTNYFSFSIASLPAVSGQVSSPVDFGSTAHATRFRWRAKSKVDLAPQANGTVDIYWTDCDKAGEWSSGSGNLFGTAGNFASGNAMFTSVNAIQNMQFIGSIQFPDLVAGKLYSTSGLTELFGRYGAVAFVNNTGVALTTDESSLGFALIPEPDELQ